MSTDENSDYVRYRKHNKIKKQSTDKKKYQKGDKYDKVIKYCIKANVEVTGKNSKKKEYPQLLEACIKRKKDIVKKLCLKMTDYTTILKNIDNNIQFTNKLEKHMNATIKNLHSLDKLIDYINNIVIETDKNNSIRKYMSSDKYEGKLKLTSSSGKKSKIDLSKFDGNMIEAYSAILT